MVGRESGSRVLVGAGRGAAAVQLCARCLAVHTRRASVHLRLAAAARRQLDAARFGGAVRELRVAARVLRHRPSPATPRPCHVSRRQMLSCGLSAEYHHVCRPHRDVLQLD